MDCECCYCSNKNNAWEQRSYGCDSCNGSTGKTVTELDDELSMLKNTIDQLIQKNSELEERIVRLEGLNNPKPKRSKKK